MFFTPPELSDEAAYELCEFFHYFAMMMDSHYIHQLRRYSKKMEARVMSEEEMFFENEPVDPPF